MPQPRPPLSPARPVSTGFTPPPPLRPKDVARVCHAFTVDVEDWFHILESTATPAVDKWPGYESRVERGTGALLDLLDRHQQRGTFFVLGWVAARYPDLVNEIVRRGHEVGSHSHHHGLVSAAGPDAFARDLDDSLEALSRATGQAATCFRAPGFSIGWQETWAFDILLSRGITLDSSLFLADRAHGGFALERSRPFDIVLKDGRRLLEAPLVPLRLPKGTLSWSGGGYLRLLPQAALLGLFAHAERAERGVVTYVHPREVDPDQPRLRLPLHRRFKYYVGLNTVLPKLDTLFQRYRFDTLSAMARGGRQDPPLVL